ncbi:MAG: PP2C family protein-serine/threonine phosphatase [Planctomycetota bacterium]|jgi:sigma-B regulation protein RsbU (phosphoserine phosphatase)
MSDAKVDVEALQMELARQQALNDANHALHSTLDLDVVFGLTLQLAIDGVASDRGTVFLVSEDRTELFSRLQGGEGTFEIRLPMGKGLAGSVAENGETIRIADAYEDERFDQSWDKKTGYRTRQILCTAIRNRDKQIVGVFQMLNKLNEDDFTPEDEAYLDSISTGAALALENAQWHEAAIEKERYDKEVALAQKVQRKLQPETRTLKTGVLSVAGLNELCEDASGDYYDMLPGVPGGRIAVTVGDVSGHGLQAALVMAEARAFLRAFVTTKELLTDCMDNVNDFLCPDMDPSKFMTIFAATINPETGEVDWCNCGHDAPYLYRADTGKLTELGTTGRVPGIFEGTDYKPGDPFTLEKGDAIVIFTDGVPEARNPDREIYTEERLEASILKHVAQPGDAKTLLDGLREDLRDFMAATPSEDDITMLTVRRVE